jgi:hypothetical protein
MRVKLRVEINTQSDAALSGTGEPGSAPTAAAIANAVFEATGARLRTLPPRFGTSTLHELDAAASMPTAQESP